jgi:hypothetical protein
MKVDRRAERGLYKKMMLTLAPRTTRLCNEERLRDRNCLSFYDPQGITLIPLGSDFESEAHAPKGRLWQEPSLLKLKFWGKLRKRSQNLQIYH